LFCLTSKNYSLHHCHGAEAGVDSGFLGRYFWNPLLAKKCKITNKRLGMKVNIYLRPFQGLGMCPSE
jgi:hypothetical protein